MGENPLNGSERVSQYEITDIVSTLGEIPRKFIRELHSLTSYVKILQSKEIFSQVDMKPFIYAETLKALEQWASTNPADLQKISKYLKEVCEIRSKSDNEKVKMSDKYTDSVVTGMPAKYKKPNGKGPFELWIVEGDSCASAMENNRDKQTQAIFPIKGKDLPRIIAI